MKQEFREKTVQDIARRRGSAPPIILDPRENREIFGKIKSQRNLPDESREEEQPREKSGECREYWTEGKPQELARKFPVRENPPTTLEPPPEKCRTNNIEKGNPQKWSGLLKFSLKGQGVCNALCETKQNQWEDARLAKGRV